MGDNEENELPGFDNHAPDALKKLAQSDDKVREYLSSIAPPSLSTTIAGIKLETCVYNASGPRTGSSAALSKIGSTESGAILAKSATLDSQNGNPLPRTWHDNTTNESIASMNSEGLPNSGISYYLDPKTISDSVGTSNKPYMISISGKTLADNLKMLEMTNEAMVSNNNIAAIELNLACPNVIGKPIIAYDFVQMEEVLEAVSKLACFSGNKGKEPVLGVKMPPYFDGPHFEQAANVLNKYKHIVRYVATMNTIGNALVIDIVAEMPSISSKGGFAGLSGNAVKYTALANVRKMRELLDDSIDVVGVGGITSGKDAFEMVLCGAHAVQVGTCHWNEGPKCFDRICAELRAIMKEKGYTKISDFRGKLKPWSKEGATLSRTARKKKEAAQKAMVSTAPSKTVPDASGDDTYKFISAVLMAIVAYLLADKFGIYRI
mmetsp:Transcript_33171/g.48642  ORF Transcript_33171/g.48642 Transcript_33171/m.48642 type:complete len:435 (+) Transcript_33171:64-1368(+)|eukprot:CAMPEP_0195524352 /NCGR_PEP_ID=MMETSP0794_2-20130614/24136_1 /TAXON_ID=515487 /ORGANISM="Stephanopyxis turris, Strain CCMP 815" /LENGTH=434 /DNA_ID=CAMNT_0040654555 /DNA_START=61 /DNA_END=1365 /DNA_ORIENTATION=+